MHKINLLNLLLIIISINSYSIDLYDCNNLYTTRKYKDYIDKCAEYAQTDTATAIKFSNLYKSNSEKIPNNQYLSNLYLKQAASLGSVKSQELLCLGLFDGRIGAVDYSQSFWWCSKLINSNNVSIKIVLGKEYQNGLGTSKDLVKAKNLYLDLAKNGVSDAQYELSEIFIADNDTQNGYYWLRLATANNNHSAKIKSDQLIDSDSCDSTYLYFRLNKSYKNSFDKCLHPELNLTQQIDDQQYTNDRYNSSKNNNRLSLDIVNTVFNPATYNR